MRELLKNTYLWSATLALTFTTSCGVKHNSKAPYPLFDIMNTQIINGEEVEEGAYPFMASLNSVFFGGHLCGASLIHEKYVLTAGHCTSFLSPRSSKIILGMHDRSDMSDVVEMQIEEIIDHPLYDGNVNYDFSLIKLQDPADTSRFPLVELNRDEINIPSQDDPEQIMATVMGWGTTETGNDSELLMEVSVPLVEHETCANAYPDDEITDVMMCAGYREGGKDSCQGDSGGPLIIDQNGSPLLIGTVSWGEGCAEEEKYGVYGKVSAIVDWIDEVTTGEN